MTGEVGMHGYCGGYWIGPVVAASGSGRTVDVCNGCGMERPHKRQAARRPKDA